MAGYAGSGYLSAWPDVDRQYSLTLIETSPELGYTINFTIPGTYTVWLRGYAPNGAGDSVYVGLDEQPVTRLTGFPPRQWSWANQDQAGNRVTISVTAAGHHSLRLWRREDGLRLDRVVLTTDSGYNPSDLGPTESQRRPLD